MSTPVSYTKQQLLPQSQSPSQLSAWLAGKHPGYDLVAWCFYGNLIDDKDNTDAVAYIMQFVQTPKMPQLEGIGIRPFQSGFTYDGAGTKGYLVSGDMSPFPTPAVTVTSKPWSIVTSYTNGKERSTNCVSVIDGEMGSAGAKYMLTADVACLTAGGEMKRLCAQITLVDQLGVVRVGYGPASFSPGMLTPKQAKEVNKNYNHSVKEYLDKTDAPLTDQGSYYYAIPLLAVESFKLTGDNGEVLSEGSQGTMWMDYVVQSFHETAWKSSLGATWQWFAIQFPQKRAALTVSIVETPDKQLLPTAMFFRSTTCKTPNGAIAAEQEWSMNEISLKHDPNSEWTSPQSGRKYYMKYTLQLESQNFPVNLSLQSVRKDQEVYVNAPELKKSVAKYEGVFEVSGKVGCSEEAYSGYAWGEVQAATQVLC